MLAAPLMAGMLWWLTSKREVMGEHRNGTVTNIAAAVGFVLLLGMAYRLVIYEIPKNVNKLRGEPAVAQPATDADEPPEPTE